MKGKKSEMEKFAGGLYTTSVEVKAVVFAATTKIVLIDIFIGYSSFSFVTCFAILGCRLLSLIPVGVYKELLLTALVKILRTCLI